MRSALTIALLSVTLGSLLLIAAEPLVQDAPLPDAVAFCHTPTEKGTSYENCTCTHKEAGGAACERNENGRPRMCKWMCGHAKSCGCCVS